MMYVDARKCIKGATKTYEDAYKVTRGDFENIIRREYYNKALGPSSKDESKEGGADGNQTA